MTDTPRQSPRVAESGEELFTRERADLDLAQGEEKALCGLALSGGGIRSATFNLGVLQALQEHKLLDSFHYLSTVSGGGYIGGFWSAWRRAQDAAAQPPFPRDRDESIRHLRRFSNFLQPRLPLLSFETGRLVAAVVAALVPSLAATVGLIGSVLLLWFGTTHLIVDSSQEASWKVFLGLLVLGHIAIGVLWHRASGGEFRWGRGERLRTFGEWFFYGLWRLLAIAVAVAGWWLLWWLVPLPMMLRLLPLKVQDLGEGHLSAAVLPALAISTGALILVMVRTLASRAGRDVPSRRRWQGSLDSALAASLYLAAGSALLGLLWVGGQILAADGVAGIVSALSLSGLGGGAFAWLRRFLVRQPNKPEGGKVKGAVGPWLLQVLAYLTLAAVTLGIAALLSKLAAVVGLPGMGVVAGVCLLLAASPLVFDPAEIGLHSFYRSRLARAYLGAATAAEPYASQEVIGDDFALSALPRTRPLHLICCAANDLAGDPIPNLHRGAESAVLSGHGIQVGRRWAGWKTEQDPPTNDQEGGDEGETQEESETRTVATPTLGAAMTASAAAFNSQMGSKSMRFGQAVTFLMTALNLRLGLWVDNPPMSGGKGKRRGWLPAFYREMFSLSDLRTPRVHLSDGAHFENLGLYELVRRECRFIVVCDCGSDPDFAFDDLGNAIRRIRTDLGVEVDIDPSPLRPDEQGHSQQAAVVGSLQYGKEEPGVLVLLKPALQGNEPADVRQYARRSADFPQQTTIDQFYDEAQWEAYRRLGQHMADGLFQRLSRAVGSSALPGSRLRWTLIQALFELEGGRSVPSGLRLSLEEKWQRLEADLAGSPEALVLAEQVLGIGGRSVEPPSAVAGVVPTIRRALHLMESVCDVYRLNEDSEVVGSIGWTNRLGRWASAPLFRAWWPWLAPLHSRDLVEFLQNTFGLPSWRGDNQGIVKPLLDRRGYAHSRWRMEQGPAPEGGDVVGLGYYFEVAGHEVEVALVWVRLQGSGEERRAIWNSRDLYVPPGFWGFGIAENFLGRLVPYLKRRRRAKALTARHMLQDDPPPPALVALYAHPEVDLELVAPD